MDQLQVDEFFMEKALDAAVLAGEHDEVPVGAVIVFQGEIIATGQNQREQNQDALGHAEIAAIRSAQQNVGSWRLEDCDLYVTLEPCMMCAGAMIQARIRRVIYGAKDPKSGMAGSVFDVFALPGNHRVDVTGGVLWARCGTLLTSFFRRQRQNAKAGDTHE